MSIKDCYNKEEFKTKMNSDQNFLAMMIMLSQTPAFEQISRDLTGGDFDNEYNKMIEEFSELNTEQLKPMLVDFLLRYKEIFKSIVEDNKKEIEENRKFFEDLKNSDSKN